jgi:hypothetical protein
VEWAPTITRPVKRFVQTEQMERRCLTPGYSALDTMRVCRSCQRQREAVCSFARCGVAMFSTFRVDGMQGRTGGTPQRNVRFRFREKTKNEKSERSSKLSKF